MAVSVGFEPTDGSSPSLVFKTSAINQTLPTDHILAVPTRLELATSCVTGRHSNQLNYGTTFEGFKSYYTHNLFGRDYRIRTYDILVPNQALYQAELNPEII